MKKIYTKYVFFIVLLFNFSGILAQGIQALDGSNRYFRFATVYDWDCCLFGTGCDEGQPYIVDGHYKIQYNNVGQGVIVESTGSYVSRYPVGTAYNSPFGYSSNPIYKSLVTNPSCCNADGSKIFVALSDEIILPKINIVSVQKATMCVKDSFTVGYGVTGTYASNNTFKAFLSNNSGSFNTEIEIGSINSIAGGLIKCNLAGNILPEGNGYKIRVKSSNPASISDTSLALTFYDKPHFANDTSITIICSTDTKNLNTIYNANGYTLFWNTNSPTSAGLGEYIVRAINGNGCSDTAKVMLVQDISRWTGEINTDWHTTGNWNNGHVPTEQTHVIIPAGTSNCIISTADAAAASLQVKPGATYKVINNNKLKVAGTCSSLPPGF